MRAGTTATSVRGGPRHPFPAVTIPDLVLAQAQRRPAAVAVIQGEERLTYQDLATQAAVLAARLREIGVGPGTRVGIAVRRRPHLVTAVLGTLLAGGTYVPVDPSGPPLRRSQILRDAGAAAVVTDRASVTSADGWTTVNVEECREASQPPVGTPHATGEPAADAWRCPTAPGDPAYVMYTSGSTGRPKGVIISHRSVVAYVLAFGAVTGAGPGTVAFAFAALGFDVSVLDIFVPLAAGGAVALIPDDDRGDPARIQHFAETHLITWGCLPVVLLPLLDPARLPTWRTVITGAEAPGPEQVARWTAASGRRFLNCYGPTEATVCVTAFEASGHWDRPLPIGAPLPNHSVYLVDETLAQVPDGVPGELLISGPGLAVGYLGQPALTAERFIPDPFGQDSGARLYRTGDLAVRQPDGNLLFLGRIDRQVKIRGQRVEPGEVESVLRAYPGIAHAVVEAIGTGPDRSLVAFASPAGQSRGGGSGGLTDRASAGLPDTLNAYCAARLPAAAIPAQIVIVDRMPLTSSGKVDTAALITSLPVASTPSPPAGDRPAGPVEEAVADAWSLSLGLSPVQIGRDDDFFAQGGHSVAAMQMVAVLRDRTGRAVTVEDVFAARTLARLAARVAEAPAADAAAVPTGSWPALSPAQQRLWFLDALAPGGVAYNITHAERMRGPLDVAALRVALGAVAARHDVLRWRIESRDGRPGVMVVPPGPAPFDEADLSALPLPEQDQALAMALQVACRRRFDLATDPLWHTTLLRLADDEHVLALTFHHAIFDGWSQAPFLADLSRAYAAAAAGAPADLGTPAVTFADYVAWRADRDAERGAADLGWWAAHLAGAPTEIRLPGDRPRPEVQTYAGDLVRASLSATITAAVRTLAAQVGTPVSAVLLAAFSQLLYRVTGRTDLVIGTPAADRRNVAFHPLVGFFIEVIPLRVRVDPAASFTAEVRGCGDELLTALAHPAASLERIVEILGLPRDPARAPLVQVLFNVYNFPEPQLALPGITATREDPGPPGSPFDLTAYVAERDGALSIDFLYNSDLFDRHRMQALADGFGALIEQWAQAPRMPCVAAALPDEGRLRDGVTGILAGRHQDGTGRSGTGRPAAGNMPVTPTERVVAQVWRDVLGLTSVTPDDNFFDVGGTSLKLTVVQARLAALLGRELPIVEFFRYPSIRALADALDGAAADPDLRHSAERAAARRARSAARSAARRAEPARAASPLRAAPPAPIDTGEAD